MSIRVTSTLDQAVIIQVVGNFAGDYDGATNINGPLPCLADSTITIGLAWDDWHPYIGVEVNLGIIATVGELSIQYVVQG